MKINKSKFRWLPRVNVTKGYMNVRGWRVSWLGFEVWHTEERRTPYALDGATGAVKEQARRNEFLRKYFPSIYPPRK